MVGFLDESKRGGGEVAEGDAGGERLGLRRVYREGAKFAKEREVRWWVLG